MKKQALKIVLALVLVLAGIITPLALKTSVKALEIRNPQGYYLSGIGQTGVIQSGMMGEMLDKYENELIFNLNLQEINNEMFKYYFVSFIYNNSTKKLHLQFIPFFERNEHTGFTLTFNYTTSRYGGLLSYSTLSSFEQIYIDYEVNILNSLCDGFNFETNYPWGDGVYSSDIIDTNDTGTYFCMSVFKPRVNIQNELSEEYERGKEEVLNNPNNYNLYSMSQAQQEIENAYDDGLVRGYNDGYLDGSATPDSFEYRSIMATVWQTASNFLNTNLLGNIKILHLITLPLLVGLFLIVLKIFRS